MKKFFAILSAVLFFSLFVNPLFAVDYYWENPASISSGDARFPRSVSNGKASCVLWQEIDTKNHTIYLSSIYYDDIDNPTTLSRFAGPVKYSGEVPDIYSAVMKADGSVYVAFLTGVNEITVYSSMNKGISYSTVKLSDTSKPLVAPRLYEMNDGSLMLFATLAENESFSIVSSNSSTGLKWSNFSVFEPSANKPNSFSPALATAGRSTYVVFQAQLMTGSRISYQLYGTVSEDNGRSWSKPVLLTDQNSILISDSRVYTNYQNQQPCLYSFNDRMYLAWERTYYMSENANINIAEINQNGLVSGSAEALTSSGNAARVRLFSHNNMLSAVWFDNRSGSERVYFAQKNGYYWEEDTLSNNKLKNMFAFPVFSNQGTELSFIWEQSDKKKYSITMLKPDTQVREAKIQPQSFREGKRSVSKDVRIKVTMPDDSSGIAGYSYSWSKDILDSPPDRIMNLPRVNTVNLKADDEGEWYFRVKVFDNAGNISPVSKVTYYLDNTPPKKPDIDFLELDEAGLSKANTIFANVMSDDVDVAGYTYSLDYAAAIPKVLNDSPRHPTQLKGEELLETVSSLYEKYKYLEEKQGKVPSQILTKSNSLKFTGRRNGIYVLTVAAIDEVGNISERSAKVIILNQYIPYTYIVSAKTSVNELGEVTLNITGGGFTYDGYVNSIYIDRDGAAPYDMVLNRADGHYQIASDNTITNIKLGNNLDEGMYKIGLLHSDRGLYLSGSIIKIEHNGTVKIEPEITFTPDWKSYSDPHKYRIRVNVLLLIAIVVLSLAILIFAGNGFISTARETVIVRKEVLALISGDIMPSEKKKRQEVLKKKGLSLKWKLVGFTAALVIAIVAVVAVPLGYIMTDLQERTLSKGLEQRIEVLLESLSSSAKTYMPLNNVLELSYLPSQAESMTEVSYVTIIGASSDESRAGLNYVWATNDEKIIDKIDTQQVNYGVSAVIDELVMKISENCSGLNDVAVSSAGEIAANISELNAEGISLALKTDASSVARREEIASITTELNARLTATLNEISKSGM